MKFILISHGRLASGILSAVEVILGKQSNVVSIDMYLDDETLDEKLFSLKETDGFLESQSIILTDIFGGSVNQKAITSFDLTQTKIITGMNLPLVLELLTLKNDFSDEKIQQLVFDSRKQIQFVNDLLLEDTNNDDF
ncbi:PTS sugar transporter subunit IIA [Enterococcus sp. LJL90]